MSDPAVALDRPPTLDQHIETERLAERSGFTLEGHLRQNKRGADDTITGTLLYGLLRDTAGAAELRWHGGNR